MADQTLGQLIVRLLLEDEGYKSGIEDAKGETADLGKHLDSVADSARRGFTAALKIATGAAVGLATASAMVGSNFERQMAAVAAVRGITDKTSDAYVALENKARELGASTIYSATQAAEGMEMLARAGLSVEETISASDHALNLAAASGISMAEATSIIASSMAQFSIDADKANMIADVFISTTQNSQFSAIEMAEAMKYAGTAGAALGMSIEETSAAVAQFRNLGLDASMAGVQFRNVVTQLAKPSKQATDALKDMGLTVADVSLETNSFREVMLRLAEAGMTTEQAVAIFSKRSGTNMKALADQFRQSTEDYDNLMFAIESGAGDAETAVKTMTDNVWGAFKTSQSAAEELLLVLFDQFAPGLQRVLTSTVGLFNKIANAVSGSSKSISGNLNGALDGIADWIDENGEMFADTFASALDQAASFGRTVSQTILPVLKAIIPILDEIVLLMGLVWVTRAVMNFASAIQGVITAMTAAKWGARALFTELTAMSGGTLALVAAVGTLVTGLGLLAARFLSAERAANRLQAAQDELAASAEERSEALANSLVPVLEKQQKLARELLESGGELSQARAEELEQIIALDKASAALAVSKGELIRVGNELRTVESLVAEVGVENVDLLKTYADEAEKGALKAQLMAGRFRDAMEAGNRSATEQNTLILALRERYGDLVEDVSQINSDSLTAFVDSAEAEAEAGFAAATAIRNQIAETAGNIRRTASETTDALRGEINTRVKDEKDGEEKAASFKLDVIDDFLRKRHAKHQEWLAEDRDEMLRQNREIERILKAREMDRDAFQARVSSMVREAELRDLNEVERLEREKAEVMESISTASAEDRLAIEYDYDLRIQEARARHVDDLKRKVEILKEQRTDVWDVLTTGVKAFNDALQTTLGIASSVGNALAQFAGFDFSFGAGINEILSVVDEIEQTRKLGDQDRIKAMRAAAENYVRGLVEKASLFVEALVQGIPVLIRELIAALPKVIGGLIAALPEIIEALRAGLVALIQSLPGLVQMLADALPGLVKQLLLALADIIVALLEALPDIVTSIVEMLPDLITALIEGLMEALPKIVMAAVRAIPQIITAIVRAIPQIITAIVDQLPLIITTLVRLVPEIIVAVGEALPELLPAIIMLVPEIMLAVAKGIPEVAKALWESLWEFLTEGLPAIGKAIAEGFWNALLNLGKAIGDFFAGLFGGGKDDKSEGSAYMGMEYVPATMRVTVHRGDRIVAPHRAPGRVPSQVADAGGPAPSQGFLGGSGAGNAASAIYVLLDGRLVDSALVSSAQAGRGGRLLQEARRSSGVKVGLSTGRFNRWTG